MHLAILLLVVVAARLLLLRMAGTATVDGYYWMLYREYAIRQNRVPPVIDLYLCDLRQWYVPVFGWVLKHLPEALFRNGQILTQILSLARLALLFLYGRLLSPGIGPETLLVLALIYFSSPALIIHDTQLNPRILGAIVFDALVFLLHFSTHHPDVWSVAALFPLLLLLMFLHKLALQLILVLLPAHCLISGTWMPLVILPAAVAAAFVAGYKKYFLAHRDISGFWFRNRMHVGTGYHQVDNSPVYGRPVTHSMSLKPMLFQIVLIAGLCPYALLPWRADGVTGSFSMLILVTYGAALATTVIPALRCWGPGRNYVYYVPGLVFFALSTHAPFSLETGTHQGLLLLCLLVCVLSSLKYGNWLRNFRPGNKELDEAIQSIRRLDFNRILVLPSSLSEEVAYRTRKRVLWGGHGHGFKLLEPVYPVILKPVPELARIWNIGVILMDRGFCRNIKDVTQDPDFRTVLENEKYLVLARNNGNNDDAYPEYASRAYPLRPEPLPETGGS